MNRYARYALATLVTLALLSTGVHAAVMRTPFEQDPSACGHAEISVYPVAEENDEAASHRENSGEKTP